MDFSLIVFDCDGVLLESVAVKTDAFRNLFLEHGMNAAERMVAYHLAHGGVSRFQKFAWFHREVLGRTITSDEERALNLRFNELCLSGVLAAPFVPGIINFLEEWHQQLPLYVASGTPDEELKEIIAKRDLGRFFQGVHGTPPDKTELLAGIVERTGVNPGKTLMVGDSSTDLDAALSVGTWFYGRAMDSGRPGDGSGDDMQGLSGFVRQVSEVPG
jgi:phosphoglycolate phosphatase-like HAD superfamily hydrolase